MPKPEAAAGRPITQETWNAFVAFTQRELTPEERRLIELQLNCCDLEKTLDFLIEMGEYDWFIDAYEDMTASARKA